MTGQYELGDGLVRGDDQWGRLNLLGFQKYNNGWVFFSFSFPSFPVYTLDLQIDCAIQDIRQQVGGEKVLVLVSGGVDSAVSAALLLKALPADRIYAIHVDHGFMRQGESDEICDALKSMGLVHLKRMNAQDFFFNTVLETPDGPVGPLTTLNDPEKRRFVIGTLFIKLLQQVVEEMARELQSKNSAQRRRFYVEILTACLFLGQIAQNQFK